MSNEIIDYPASYFFGLGIKTERERIIELIEETLMIHTDQKFFLIRAIKAEQK